MLLPAFEVNYNGCSGPTACKLTLVLPPSRVATNAPALVLDVEGLALGLEFCIQFRQLLPEIIQTALEVFVRYEEVLFYVILFYTVASFTREDNQLAYNVHSAQVNTWIRLAIALLFGKANGLQRMVRHQR